MTKRKLLALISIVLLLTILPVTASCKASPSSTAAPKTTQAVTTPAAPSSIVIRALRPWPWETGDLAGYREFVKRVNDRAEGRLVIKDFGGNEVYPAMEQFKPLQLGKVDMVYTAAGYIAADFPELNTSAYSFGATPEQRRSSGLIPLLDKIARTEHGLTYLGEFAFYGAHIWLGKKPIKTLADLKPMKIRTSQDWYLIVNKLGVATVIPIVDTYTALDRGVVDGLAMPDHGLFDFGLEDVVKYRVDPPLWSGPCQVALMNAKMFDGLPKDLQKLLNDTAAEVDKDSPNIIGSVTAAESKLLGKLGVTSIQLTQDEWKQTQQIGWDEGIVGQLKKLTPKYADDLIKIHSQFYPPKAPYVPAPLK